ncbi:MAG: DMSO reductase family type II enzyme heme b subunit [Haloarculaceae archaeon]|jgi:DMSO reductase family type II enzyme heme b subunit
MSDYRRELVLAGTFAVVLLAATAAAPMIGDARPAFEIPVTQASEDADLGNVSAQTWTEIPAATLSLSSAGASVPAADDTTVERATLAAAQTDEQLYLRLSWGDKTRDRSTSSLRLFADAVAVQLPTNTSVRPPIAMGSPNNPVNVWYWSAANSTEELIAGGPGSTTPFDQTQVATDATYSDGRWHVVVSRSLDAPGTNRTTIPGDADMDLAVAVWNGSNMERSGQKSASDWHYLALGPGPQGPPYETILWVIAGLGIVVSALVTVEGVRRTRGE